MIFSSWEFIFLFLPLVFCGYFLLNRIRLIAAGKAWLVAASLVFYCYWSITYLPLLLGSICFNFAIGSRLTAPTAAARLNISRWWILIVGIGIDLGLLMYFKYANFFIDNLNFIAHTKSNLAPIALPLGISFFTFTQIAYLVDSYRGQVKEYDILNYALFVTFFPHLIAGPILHHEEMMSQFRSRWTLAIRYRNIALGLFIFSLGLFKKAAIADTFAIWANAGFDSSDRLDFFSAWVTSLAYTFQLYFDFSGYSDMAIGAALFFNIWLPLNFNSPYQALDIQDFWRRWHITLGSFLRNYLYIPLGGNRCSTARTYLNLLITFTLGGLWHGASWMFIIWGALHGVALVIQRAWSKFKLPLPQALAWLLTFGFVNMTWVFFRAKTLADVLRVLGGMVDFGSIANLPISAIPTANLAWGGTLADRLLQLLPVGLAANIICLMAIAGGFIIISQKNSFELMSGGMTNSKLICGFVLFCIAMYCKLATASSVFLYFNF